MLSAAVCWSTIGVAYRLVLDEYDVEPVTIVTLRATTAAIVLCGFMLRRRSRLVAFSALFDRRSLLPTLAIGLLSTTGFYVALIFAFEDAGVAVGTVLLYLAPSLVALGAWLFFRETLSRRQLLALGLALAGVIGVSGLLSGAGQVTLSGLALGLLSAAGYASYSLFGHLLLGRATSGAVVTASLGIGAVGLWAVKLLTSGLALPEPAALFWIVVATGFGTTLIPMVLYTRGLSVIGPSRAILIATLEPVLAVVWAFVILGEALSAPQQVGGALVVLSIVVANTRRTS